MKCLLILASLAMLAASSPYKGYDDDSGWRGVGQPGVFIPEILLRGALQPKVHIPLERQRTISMRYPSMTAGTMPGLALLDDRAAVGDADMMDMEARNGEWVKKLIDMLKGGGKKVFKAATKGAVNQLIELLQNSISEENADMMNMDAREDASEQTKETKQ